jgi:hypothetical protein
VQELERSALVAFVTSLVTTIAVFVALTAADQRRAAHVGALYIRVTART